MCDILSIVIAKPKRLWQSQLIISIVIAKPKGLWQSQPKIMKVFIGGNEHGFKII